MIEGLIGLAVGLAIVAYLLLARYGRGRAGEAVREHAHTAEYAPFVIGYLAALDDVERTGLRPNTTATQNKAAERAFRRRYIERS